MNDRHAVGKSLRERLGPQAAQLPQDRPFASTGGRGRSREFYIGQEQYELEMTKIFGHHWLPIEHVSRLSEPGMYVTVRFSQATILVVNTGSKIQAYHNYCRHRGWELVQNREGSARSFMCDYHCWVYTLDGKLKAYKGTFLNDDWDPDKNGLLPIRTEVRHGMVFICLGDSPGDLDKSLGDFPIFAEAYDLANQVLVDSKDYAVEANWKLVMHNINESLHFETTHWDVHSMTDYDDAAAYDVRGNLVSAWNRILKGYNTVSLRGITDRAPIPTVPEEDRDKVTWLTILPNLMFGFSSDYTMIQSAWPVSPQACLVRCSWLFNSEEASKRYFDASEVVDLWDKVNHEDWEVCERAQRGIASPYWVPGPLSLDEELVAQIDHWISQETSSK